MGVQLVSTKEEDDDKYDGEALVVLNLEQECRSRFQNFDLKSEPNSAEDTMEVNDPWELYCWDEKLIKRIRRGG
jgi:hypothetical protein